LCCCHLQSKNARNPQGEPSTSQQQQGTTSFVLVAGIFASAQGDGLVG
jgi:hypothetical protein